MEAGLRDDLRRVLGKGWVLQAGVLWRQKRLGNLSATIWHHAPYTVNDWVMDKMGVYLASMNHTCEPWQEDQKSIKKFQWKQTPLPPLQAIWLPELNVKIKEKK